MEGQRSNFMGKTRIETAIWASKLVLLVVGAISSVTLFKVAAIPYLHDLALSTVPGVWSSFKASWVSPLYIYIAVNLVIAAIVVSSAFTRRNDNNPVKNDKSSSLDKNESVDEKTAARNNSWESFHILLLQEDKAAESLDGQDSLPPRGDDEKEETPGSDGGGESSLEDTWMAIMASKGLKRSETVGPSRPLEKEGKEVGPAVRARKEMKKSETFSDRVSFRRDASIGPEELGRRADAFIKKVNDDMRLQRLESEQRRGL